MTVETDIQAQRIAPLFYLKIDGVEEIFCTQHHLGVPSGTRAFLQILDLPHEHSTDLNLGDMMIAISAMEFVLKDFQDTDGTYWLSRLFATARWDTGTICRLLEGTAANQYVDADATTIPVKSTTGFPTSGTAYIGQETITYTGVTGTSLTGADKGLWPCVPSTLDRWGFTYPRFQNGQKGLLHHISQYPYTMVGRRVSFWVTTWNETNEQWNPEAGEITIFDDQFADASIDALWTTVLNYGTVVEAGGVLTLDIDATPNSVWTADYKKYTGAYVGLSDIGMFNGGLICVETSLYCNLAGPWSDLGIALYEDDENMVSVVMNYEGSVAHGKSRIYRATDNVFTYSDRHATDLGRDCLLRLYWNSSTTETFTIANNDTIAPGRLHGYFSNDGGTTWVTTPAGPQLFPTTDEAVTIVPNAIMIWGHGGSSTPIDVDFQYITVTQTPPEGTALILWAGRISTDDSIRQDGGTGKWHLGCKSILEDLKRPLLEDPPKNYLHGINLMGDLGRGFTVNAFDSSGTWLATGLIEANKGRYTINSLMTELTTQANTAANWTTKSGSGFDAYIMFAWDPQTPDRVGVDIIYGLASSPTTRSVRISGPAKGQYSHALAALGFDGWLPNKGFSIDLGESGTGDDAVYKVAENQPYDDYMAIHRSYNGNKLYVYRAADFWATQGDSSTTQAYVKVEDAKLVSDPKVEREGIVYFRYTAIDTTNNFLTIDHVANTKYSVDGFIGKEHNGDFVDVVQCFVPTYGASGQLNYRGPFEQLLYPLLSTGTDGYNEDSYAYDSCPLPISVGMQEALVDVQSFIDADAAIMHMEAAQRPLWPWTPKETWFDRAQKECKMFGRAMVWRRGKIALVDILSPNTDIVDVTINKSNRAGSGDFPDQTIGIGSVVNRYTFKLSSAETDREQTIVFTDANSAVTFQQVKDVSIEHGGLNIEDGSIYWPGMLEHLPHVRDMVLSVPSPVVDVAVPHSLMYRLWVGSTVRFISSVLADPLGTGTRSVNTLATCIGARWDYESVTGSATLALHGRYSRLGLPYSPSALVDITAGNGGWDDGNDRITLIALTYGVTGDPDDGAALAPTGGEELLIVERAPADPTSCLYWRVTVKAATPYETDGAQILSLAASTTLTDWDAAKEYIVTFADWDTPIVSAQESLGTFWADETTELLDSGSGNDPSQRYG